MTDLREITTGNATRRLLEILQQQPTVDGVQPAVLHQLQEAAEQIEREQAEMGRAARAEVEAARAEAAATRAKAEQAVKALAESEQRYRYMGETIPFGVWWCNPKGEAEYVSPSFCELLDMTVEEQNKFGWTKRLVPEDVEPMMSKWMHTCATGIPWDHEHRIIDRHGKIHTVWSRGLPVRDEREQIIAWVGVNLDITERKRIELQLKEAKEALEQALHVKDQFLANISHELRTPLTLVLGPVRKMLAAANLSDEQRHDLNVVQRNARTLLKNVNDLLDLSKLDAGRMKAEYAEVDVARLGRYVASHFESIADDKQIHFEVQTPESLHAQVDPEKLQRILFNLLSNAFKFTPAQGSVRFRLRAEGAKVVVAVEDTGPGIPPQMRQTIFERFRQVEGGPTRRHGGTGLGLAIVKEFVNLHQGSVGVTEAAGGGARLTVELPLAAPGGTEVKAAEPAPDEEAARGAIADLRTPVDLPTHPGGPVAPDAPLVLVVEDNPEMNAFVAQSLGDRHRVARAFDGREGLEKAMRLRPDLIISDLMMPQMSGEDLVREVRKRSELDEVPILLLTAKADENLRVTLLSTGAQDCLTKPFVTEELVARAAGLIARKRKAEASLRESYALLHAVTEGVTDAIFVKDAQGCYRMINSAGAQRLGQSVQEVLGRNDAALLDAEAAARSRADDQQIMVKGQTLTFEESRASGGVTRTYLTTKGPHRDHEGRVTGVLGISVDITQRKQMEEELRTALAKAEEGERMLNALMEHIPEGITIADAPEVKIRRVSRHGQELLGGPHAGMTADQVAGQWKVYHRDGVTRMADADLPLVRAILKGETIRGEELVEVSANGQRLPLLCNAAPIRDGHGAIVGGVVAWRDISERKQAEEEIRQLNADLERRVEQRTSELAAANKELEAFAYTVSHDLRAPLRHISGFVEMLGDHAAATLDEEGRDYLRTIAEAAERMGSLIDDLLALSRLGRASMSESDVDLGRLVEEARAELAPAMVGRTIEWQVGPLPHVRGDRTLLRNAVVNLLSNAIKYSRLRNPARIEIGSREENGQVVCFVKDNGAGFDMRFVDKLFGVFQRLHPVEKFEGTGVGLASVRRIIERHGGRTWAEGAVNQGATFYFALPTRRKGA